VSRLTAGDLKFETNSTGKFIRVTLNGGKTQLCANHQNEKIIPENLTNPDLCLYKLTEKYLEFLGKQHKLKHNQQIPKD